MSSLSDRYDTRPYPSIPVSRECGRVATLRPTSLPGPPAAGPIQPVLRTSPPVIQYRDGASVGGRRGVVIHIVLTDRDATEK